MKTLVSGLCAVLIIGCASAAAQDAGAQGATDGGRYVLLERELTVEIEGNKGISASLHLLRFDTATGRVWRFERRNWGDPSKARAWFVPIPLEGAEADAAVEGTERGRFQLLARAGGRASLPFPDVVILDAATGRTWVYRGISQIRNGVAVMNETFALVTDTGPQ
ncbi:MAG: hypothetical protein ACE148_07010 [Vicinamibacterales bacterium]